MQPFAYTRVASSQEAIRLGAREGARFLGGGTNLVDLMRLDVEAPDELVDLAGGEPDGIERLADGGVRIGAGVRNADLAHDAYIRQAYPVLSQAVLSGASAQVRNLATTAGNLLQRTRCVYFRDAAMPCNKRDPGSGCPAQDGYNRNLAILGTSAHCLASNPSDMSVAMLALDAGLQLSSSAGERTLPLAGFHCLPGNTPERETRLKAGELITHVCLPAPPADAGMLYVKLRDRASFEFALASAAAVVAVADGRIRHVRLALGGVGTVPWRAHHAERELLGHAPGPALFDAAARTELAAAQLRDGTRFKGELARRCIVHALERAVAMSGRGRATP
ncbi:xanthine dehydrogenase family protein subunit M [Verticiella sediminum]|uniref:Xanthine dehydrogenase family protein subunit M n=1 Tax=Verticiella sediminum TaxID=1247510 RepID=A0A556A8Z2_9BURK|nr:xanthine dehydrogenase family protein subunit M [Verticiella sediminum]TSH89357.1 xanthine dehydrogenase family protein subunit M [Verticiella sediminum]